MNCVPGPLIQRRFEDNSPERVPAAAVERSQDHEVATVDRDVGNGDSGAVQQVQRDAFHKSIDTGIDATMTSSRMQNKQTKPKKKKDGRQQRVICRILGTSTLLVAKGVHDACVPCDRLLSPALALGAACEFCLVTT